MTHTRDWMRQLLLVVCFVFFLYPISIDGNSANYSFVLFPLVLVAGGGKLRRPPEVFLLFMVFYVMIFVIAALYQYQFLTEFSRRFSSFLLFMSMFVFMFVRIDDAMIWAFKVAMVVGALFFSLLSVVIFFLAGGAALGFEAKDIVGGQRYGFIYLFGLWLLLLNRSEAFFTRLAKYAAILLILIGLVLTFSRASVFALMGGLIAFFVWSLRSSSGFSFARLIKRVVGIAIGVSTVGILLVTFFPLIFEFFEVRLFEFLLNKEALEDNLADSDTSEGTRLFIWWKIFEYVIYNPLTGSGYLGVWILRLFGEMSGSAHNQYMDVLFRVGVLGFLIHIFLLYRTARFLNRRHPDLFWGFAAAMIYGVFHETFKESQGGFVLAFLFGMMSQSVGSRFAVPSSIRRNAGRGGEADAAPHTFPWSAPTSGAQEELVAAAEVKRT